MNPPCAKCKKTVYPTEKLTCLDKVWHKGCFKCDTCGLTLNMKNYKGYNKLPYCSAHYPTTKFTAVADTPENLRLMKQSANQSNLVYHKEHRENLQKFTAVSDDPESLRLMKNTRQSSNLAYKSAAPPPSLVGGPPPSMGYAPPENQPYQQEPARYDPPPQQVAHEPAPQQPPPPSGPQYVAVYDYAAADEDEVSFVEGDIIINAEVIDAGWMQGTVKRTGHHGMLPSNYVEQS